MLAAAQHGIEAVRLLSACLIKRAVTGYGRASKVQVQEMTKSAFWASSTLPSRTMRQTRSPWRSLTQHLGLLRR